MAGCAHAQTASRGRPLAPRSAQATAEAGGPPAAPCRQTRAPCPALVHPKSGAADGRPTAQEPGALGQGAAPELARSSGGSEYFRTNSGGLLSKIKRHLPGTTVRLQPRRRLAHTAVQMLLCCQSRVCGACASLRAVPGSHVRPAYAADGARPQACHAGHVVACCKHSLARRASARRCSMATAARLPVPNKADNVIARACALPARHDTTA